MVFGKRDDGVRITEHADLEYVGELEERLEVDASSKVGNGENEDAGGKSSLRRCPSPLEDPNGVSG